MNLEGTIFQDGDWWLAEIPALDAMTQGKTRTELMEMIADLVESHANVEGFAVQIKELPGDRFFLSSNNTRVLLALMLQRLRTRSGLTLMEAAGRMGASSHNAVARYEQGTSSPTIEKLEQLLKAVSDEAEIVIKMS